MPKRVTVPFAKPARLVLGLLIAVACLPALRTKSDEPAKAERPDALSMLGTGYGQVRDDNGLKIKLVWCPPGPVTMGNRDGTSAEALLTRGYWIGKFEVTQAEWKGLMPTEPWLGDKYTNAGDDFPAVWVSRDEALEFCRKLTEQERKAGRLTDAWEYALPTEAQWERACRARTETRFSFGDDASVLGDFAWFSKNAVDAGEEFAHRVGQKKPNLWGLHDMHGNVWEWCRDDYAEILPGGRDPQTRQEEPVCVTRGGSWFTNATYCRSVNRRKTVVARNSDIGFRVALSPVQPGKH